VEYELVDSSAEELQTLDGDMFIGEELGINVEDVKEKEVEAEEKIAVALKRKKSPEETIQEAVKKKVRKKVSEQK